MYHQLEQPIYFIQSLKKAKHENFLNETLYCFPSMQRYVNSREEDIFACFVVSFTEEKIYLSEPRLQTLCVLMINTVTSKMQLSPLNIHYFHPLRTFVPEPVPGFGKWNFSHTVPPHGHLYTKDTPSLGPPNSRTIFEDSDTSRKHPSTMITKLYSNSNSWIV